MNKILLTTLVALLFVCATVEAQVKDTYKDKSNEMTTVVVKEDTADDMDILNDQFDLDNVGMHQVIRITTREEATAKVVTEDPPSQEITNAQLMVTSEPITSEPSILTASVEHSPKIATESPVINTIETTTEEIAEEFQQEEDIAVPAPVTAEEPIAKTSMQKSTRSSGYSSKNKSNKYQFKTFNKKFKKQKRKRVPRKRKRNKRCYRF